MEINDLPPELIVTIFKFISKEEILKTVHNVCIMWMELSMSASLWTQVDLDRLVTQNILSKAKLFSIMSNVLNHVQHLTVSPKLLESYFAQTKAANLGHVHTLQFSYSKNYMSYVGKILPLLPMKCPQLKDIHVGVFFGNNSSIMNKFIAMKMKLRHVHFYLYDQHFRDPEQKDYSDDSDSDDGFGGGVYHVIEKTDELVQIFQNHTDLFQTYKTLSLHSMYGTHIEEFLKKDLPNLKSLDCSFLSEKTLNAIAANGESLKDLKLDFSNLDDCSFSDLIGKLPNLKTFKLSCWNLLSDRVVSKFIASCEKLEEISIRNSSLRAHYWNSNKDESKLTLAALPSPSKIKVLKALSFQNIKTLDHIFFTDLMQNLKLESLSLNSCIDLNDTSLEIIASNCRYLRSADFSQCSKITLDGVKKLLSSCTSLVNLSLLACEGLTKFTFLESNASIGDLPSGVGAINQSSLEQLPVDSGGKVVSKYNKSQLENLNMAYCTNLEVSAAVIISELCKNLRLLNLRFCDAINSLEGESHQLFQNCAHLETIYVGLNGIVCKT